ncbi:Potassium transporter [Trichinella spiralis]|uniref:Potassium transporter n=1 Tax=Trichinella spiralis TaxID=6334 RepID=A0ABR3K5I1_TRISP
MTVGRRRPRRLLLSKSSCVRTYAREASAQTDGPTDDPLRNTTHTHTIARSLACRRSVRHAVRASELVAAAERAIR